MLKNIYRQIMNTIGSIPPESGGILGEREGVLCAYYYDTGGTCNGGTYRPDIICINRVIEKWSQKSIQFTGINS